jgi:hypothetical protein
MGNLPDDACPYPRPFPEDFQECPTFERVTLSSIGATDEPARPNSTCANLTVGAYWDGTNHRYGQCRLGDSAARLARLKTQIVDSDLYVSAHADPDTPGLEPPPIMPPR